MPAGSTADRLTPGVQARGQVSADEDQPPPPPVPLSLPLPLVHRGGQTPLAPSPPGDELGPNLLPPLPESALGRWGPSLSGQFVDDAWL